MNLTAQNVQSVLMDCLFQKDEDTSNRVEVRGIVNTFGFHPARLESHRADIASMLGDLPSAFRQSKGGGWSFLNACMTNDGVQWGEHQDMERLLVLGLGLKLVDFMMPREFWSQMPGGMPYFAVKD